MLQNKAIFSTLSGSFGKTIKTFEYFNTLHVM